VRELFEHALLGHCPSDGLSFEHKVMIETRDELVRDECELFKPMMEIEQVTVLNLVDDRETIVRLRDCRGEAPGRYTG
jgi:hypothetical protein